MGVRAEDTDLYYLHTQTAVTAYFSSKQLLLFAFARQYKLADVNLLDWKAMNKSVMEN